MASLPGPKHSMPWASLKWMRTPYPYLDELSAAQGEAFKLAIFGMELNVFTNPEVVREVFSDGGDELEAGRFNRGTLGVLLGDRSVLMVDGDKHLRKRKLLLPPFHGERMQAYGQTMLDVTDDAIDSMPHGHAFSFHEPMQDVTLRVIVRTVFGFEGARLEQMVARTKELLELGTWAPLLIPAMQFELGGLSPYGRFRRAASASDDMLYKTIDAKRASGERGPDVLSLLLDARDDEGKPMSREELRDELVTLLVAGHETTATALTWTLKHLLEQPALLAELRAEIEALGPDPKPEAIAKAPLLDGTAREALRLIPVIPLVGRMLTKDRVVGGVPLKKDDIVICSIYLAHRRPEAFPDPLKFDPRRFVGKKVSAHEFFPFGGGVRRCIGIAFALYEMKMVLARIVARCDLALEGKKPVGMVRRSITITPTDGLRVILRRRKLRPSLDNGGPTIGKRTPVDCANPEQFRETPM